MNEVNPGGGPGMMVTAALVGAAVGAGMALLFAPCSGSETRRWLAHSTREIKARTTSAFGRVGRDGERATTVDAATMRT
jgi:gas vesicle protein